MIKCKDLIKAKGIKIVQKITVYDLKQAKINNYMYGSYVITTSSGERYICMTIHTGYRLYTHMPTWMQRSKKDFIDNVTIYVTEDIYIADILEKIMIGEPQPELNSKRDKIVYCDYKKDEFQQIKEKIKDHTKKMEIEKLRNEKLKKEKRKEFDQKQKELSKYESHMTDEMFNKFFDE